jgi:hypothetical protein
MALSIWAKSAVGHNRTFSAAEVGGKTMAATDGEIE